MKNPHQNPGLIRRNLGKVVAVSALCVLATQGHAADYADAAAAVTAVTGIPATVTTAFLAAATLGVSILIIRSVRKGLSKGLGLG